MLYIHIPFCQQRCIYCDFYSTTHATTHIDAYIQSLTREMEQRREEIPSPTLHSVYIGGGTPSLLSSAQIRAIFHAVRSNFTIATDAEITVEANPDDVSPALLATLLPEGVNRISMGVQTFDNATLTLLRRRHTGAQATEAVRLCHTMGIPHISIDLIYQLPHQTLQSWADDVRKALSLPIDHLSAYALTVEEQTPLHRMLKQRAFTLPTDELACDMFQHLCTETARSGFEHYEISNFCRPGCHSRHNSGYWSFKPYLGLGPSAHSFDGKNRTANPPSLRAYLAAQGTPTRQIERLTPAEQCNDFVLTSLRTSSGLNLEALAELFGAPIAEQITVWAHPHIRARRLRHTGDGLTLTQAGIMLANDVISDLMIIEEG